MNSNKNWELRVKNKVYKILSKIPENDRNRLLNILENIPCNPFAGDIEKMKGEIDVWRRRNGAYRIFYQIIFSEKIIYVFKIERRTSKTY